MSDKTSEQHNKCDESAATDIGQDKLASSRRRLLKGGLTIAPIVMTLASRPVLAWHCKSPSAWGSEVLNPNTSLKNSAGHASYVDETWSINNWITNTPRTGYGLEDDGVTGKPWSELASACTGLTSDSTLKTRINGKSVFDYRKVQIKHLVKYVPGFVNPGLNPESYAKDMAASANATYMVIAQLNYVVLKQVKFNNGIDDCLKEGQLGQMAQGTYVEHGSAWTLAKAKDYLYNNWIVRP